MGGHVLPELHHWFGELENRKGEQKWNN
jgi:hypothetical protein